MRDPDTYPEAWPTFTLAPGTGGMELAVAETAQGGLTRPERVTAVLLQCLSRIDGVPVTEDLLRRLSVGTREWLLQQVAADCRPAEDWLETCCATCGTRFDIALDLATLPRNEPAPGFPVVTLRDGDHALAFEVPNGSHEERLARAPAPDLLAFLRSCALDDASCDALSSMDRARLDAIDASLDAATPETADTVSAECPGCGACHCAALDPLSYAFPAPGRVLRDVHLLCAAYKWAEADVLAMPTRRRQTYAEMVTAARGVA